MDPLDDTEEELLRQVHPAFLQEGRPSSQALRPTPKDDDRLSVDRGSMVSARDSFDRFSHPSAGVWAVTVGEVGEVGLAAFPDPLDENEAHAVVDFEGLSQSKKRSAKCWRGEPPIAGRSIRSRRLRGATSSG